MLLSFKIDEKSLFRGLKNNYTNGFSPTIATPINQAKDPQKWRRDIVDFIEKYESFDTNKLPERLKDKCLNKTTSNANCKIVKFYTFSKFALDGKQFEVDASFCMYVKEEVDISIVKRNGEIGENTHFGRQRICYPTALSYISDGFSIDNKKVLEKIFEVNGGFAYIVNGFDIDSDSNILNFKTTMVGLKGTLLSNVFKRQKGVGLKLLVDSITFDNENILPSEITTDSPIDNEEAKSFMETLVKIQNSSRKSGKLGEVYVNKNLNVILHRTDITEKIYISERFPTSPYDIECVFDNKKWYIEVKSTKHDKKYFYMSKGERTFMEKYKDSYMLILVTNVSNGREKTSIFYPEDMSNKLKMTQEIQGIKFIVK